MSALEKVILKMNRYLALQKIIELGSFTKAAEALGYTQSAVSQMIASLEQELSLTLLIRSRHGIQLTSEGMALYPFLQQTVSQYLAMRQKADEINGLESGVIRVGTVSSVTCHWMPQLIRGFQANYPQVQFVFHQGDYSSIPEWIHTGQIDFGFINPLANSNLTAQIVKTGEMLAVLPQNHPLAQQEKIRLADLAKEPYILLEEGEYNEPMAAFNAAGLTPNIQYTLHDDYAIMTMAEAGLGISILAELVLRRTNYNIVCRSIDPPVYRTLAVVYKNKDSLPIASKYFISYLLQHKDKLP